MLKSGVSLTNGMPIPKQDRSLCHAVMYKDTEEINSLISHGRDVNEVECISCKYDYRMKLTFRTPLHVAASEDKYEASLLLIIHGADVNKPSLDGDTPLYAASMNGSLPMARLLIEHKADVNKSEKNGNTPLFIASQEGTLDVVKLLVENEAQLNKGNNKNHTPLSVAAGKGNADVTALLIEKGADVETRLTSKDSLLHVACRWGRQDIVLLLIQKGAQINATNDERMTCLHTAICEGKSSDLIEMLLHHGADIEARDKSDLNALDMAEKRNMVEIKELLLSWQKKTTEESEKNEANGSQELAVATFSRKFQNTYQYISEIETKLKEEIEEKQCHLEQLKRKVTLKVEEKEKEARQLASKIDEMKENQVTKSADDPEDFAEALAHLQRDMDISEAVLTYIKGLVEEMKKANQGELEEERRKSKVQLEKTRDELLKKGERRVTKLEARIQELERENRVLLEKSSNLEDDLKQLSIEYEEEQSVEQMSGNVESSVSVKKVVKFKGAKGLTEGIERLREQLCGVGESSRIMINNIWSSGPVYGSVAGDINSMEVNK